MLTKDEIFNRMQELPRWESDGTAIRRTFVFGDFPTAMAFVVHVGFGAEAADHHPDVVISYKRVTLSYSTHSEGGLTVKDFDGAKRADAIAAPPGLEP